MYLSLLAYSPDHLQYLIDQGCDVTLPLLEDDIESYNISDGNGRNKPSPEKLIAFPSKTSGEDEDHSKGGISITCCNCMSISCI